MASKTFDQLTELAAAPSSGDWFALVDETAGSTKKLDAKYLVATAGVVTNVTGGGTIALGGFTATIPATGTVALRNVANTFTGAQTFSGGTTMDFAAVRYEGSYSAPSNNQSIYILQANAGGAGAGYSNALLRVDNRGNNDFLSFDNNGTTKFSVRNSGRVAINTTDTAGSITINGEIALVDGMTAPDTTIGWAKLYVDDADGDLKIKFGNGTVKTIVVDE